MQHILSKYYRYGFVPRIIVQQKANEKYQISPPAIDRKSDDLRSVYEMVAISSAWAHNAMIDQTSMEMWLLYDADATLGTYRAPPFPLLPALPLPSFGCARHSPSPFVCQALPLYVNTKRMWPVCWIQKRSNINCKANRLCASLGPPKLSHC